MQESRERLKQSGLKEPLSFEDSHFFRECADLRRHVGMTQKQVAEIMGTRESAIARLEALGGRGRSMLPKLATLKRYVGALGYRLVLSLEPLGSVPGGSGPSILELLRSKVAELEESLLDVNEQLRNSEARLHQTTLDLNAANREISQARSSV